MRGRFLSIITEKAPKAAAGSAGRPAAAFSAAAALPASPVIALGSVEVVVDKKGADKNKEDAYSGDAQNPQDDLDYIDEYGAGARGRIFAVFFGLRLHGAALEGVVFGFAGKIHGYGTQKAVPVGIGDQRGFFFAVWKILRPQRKWFWAG